MSFARPHIETHSRSKGHSAVAGCAYRLGLAMTDERTGVAYDFTRKNGVVWSAHMAPENAPAWQQNAAEFWNAAEAAEKRKDAQVARDFRIPVPLGFTEEQAQELAKRMAETLRDDLGAPVSVALHRDSDRDRFGELKGEKQGFHAHIYTPARGVEMDGMAAKKLGVFLDLGNKNRSGEWVEKWNAAWATHANKLIQIHALGIVERTHLSNARQGIERPTEWKMGPAAVALERAGVRTAMGERLRAIHPTPPAMDHEAARAEQQRERQRQELATGKALLESTKQERAGFLRQAQEWAATVVAEQAARDALAASIKQADASRTRRQKRHDKAASTVSQWKRAHPVISTIYTPAAVKKAAADAAKHANDRDRAQAEIDRLKPEWQTAKKSLADATAMRDLKTGQAAEAGERVEAIRKDLDNVRKRHAWENLTPEQKQEQRLKQEQVERDVQALMRQRGRVPSDTPPVPQAGQRGPGFRMR